jgi:hypothetical protein
MLVFKKYIDILKLYRINSKNRGFSLVELSVIMSVAASAAIGYMQWIKPAAKTDSYNSRITQQTMNIVRDKLVMHAMINKRLPCPASPNVNTDNTNDDGSASEFNFGEEALSFNIAANDYSDCLNTVGSVPVVALGLTGKYMFDEWGRRLTYHVTPNLCNDADNITVGSITIAQRSYVGCTKRDYADGFEINSTDTNKDKGNISIYKSTTVNPSNLLTDKAAFVLVSHGANGNGAYLASGKRMPITVQTDDDNFDSYTNDLDSDGLTYFKLSVSSTYDDLVLFATKSQINKFSKKLNNRIMTAAECEANSIALSLITNSISTNLDSDIDDYEITDGTTTYNEGSDMTISILWALQDVCSSSKYYGETNSGGDWTGARCPGGAVYTNGKCVCDNTLWSGSC